MFSKAGICFSNADSVPAADDVYDSFFNIEKKYVITFTDFGNAKVHADRGEVEYLYFRPVRQKIGQFIRQLCLSDEFN